MTDLGLRRPGRPRQPYCPDCKKEGRPFEKKRPGQGYCTTHHIKRTKESYERRMRAENPSYVPRELLTPTLELDIKAALGRGMPLTVEMIRSLYMENGLPVPNDEALNRKYFPDAPVPKEDPRDAGVDAFNEALAKYQASEENPYDPS